MLHSFRPFKGTVQWYYDLQLDLNNGPNQDVVTWQLLPFKETLSPSQLWFLFWKLMEIVFRGFGICICLFWFDLTFIWQGKSKLSFDMIIILIETHKAQGKGLQILVGQFLLLSFANSNYSNSFSSSLSFRPSHVVISLSSEAFKRISNIIWNISEQVVPKGPTVNIIIIISI